MRHSNYSKFLIIGYFLLQVHPAFSMDVAITVDDLPSNGQLPSSLTRIEVANKILSVFKKHQIKEVYGLINGLGIEENKDGFAILQRWIDEGQLLGNHTYHHLDLAKENSVEYTVDINKNEFILKQLMTKNDYHFFRYPYLSEGNSQEKRDTVRKFLFDNNYKIAPVTVDFFEYEWNDPYVRCVEKKDELSIQWLRETYIEQALNALIITHTLSDMLFNRDIKNILLIHMNVFTAEMLDELLTAYETQGIRFISLVDALNDSAYQINPNIVRDRAYTFLNQVRLSRGLKNPEIVEKLHNSLPEEKLDQLCR